MNPRAFWLKAPSGPLASWLHLPQSGTIRSCAVVICPPMGFEYTHSHRSLRHLAEAFAEEGFLAVRFDYHGCGNSPGDAFSPQQLRTWVADIRAVVREATLLNGSHAVALVGLRLGALLAALAAAEIDVDYLIAWSPVVSGRRYIREQLAIAGVGGGEEPPGQGYIEGGGFVLSDETAGELKTVDLSALHYRVGRAALVVERDDLPQEKGLAEALNTQGIRTTVTRPPGYAGMMAEPQDTVVPREAIDSIVEWLSERVPTQRLGLAPDLLESRTSVTSCAWEGDVAFVEELCWVDAPAPIFGVLTTATSAKPGGPVFILTNAGSVHHVGPNRLYVELSRQLARHGFASFRFDLRNLGDSARGSPAEENHPYPVTAMDDVEAALRWLTQWRGFDTLVVAGLCSGAHTAFHVGAAVDFPSLQATLLLNPLTFFWTPGMSLEIPSAHRTVRDAKYYALTMRHPSKWLKLLRGQADLGYIMKFAFQRTAGLVRSAWSDTLELLGMRSPGRLARDLNRYVSRGRAIDFVFSRDDPGFELLISGGRWVAGRLRRRGLSTVQFVEGADHTFSRKAWRDDLIERTVAQAIRRFGSRVE
jgi:alpha-beta hydrolase superfamily lysophospholipase